MNDQHVSPDLQLKQGLRICCTEGCPQGAGRADQCGCCGEETFPVYFLDRNVGDLTALHWKHDGDEQTVLVACPLTGHAIDMTDYIRADGVSTQPFTCEDCEKAGRRHDAFMVVLMAYGIGTA